MIKRLVRRLMRALDDEKVLTFQAMYYVLFTSFALVLITVPHIPTQEASTELTPLVYHAWLGVNLVCPPMTLLGRRLGVVASRRPAGHANPAVGAAWLQLAGDLGVWGSVNLWVGAMLSTDWWMSNLFVAFFMGMGVIGGSMFTARSVRRLFHIKQVERHLP